MGSTDNRSFPDTNMYNLRELRDQHLRSRGQIVRTVAYVLHVLIR